MLIDGKNAVKRLLYNHPMQGAVSDIFNIVALRVSDRVPCATFKYGMHDSQKWGVPVEKYKASRVAIMNIVNAPWKINGRDVVLPATFKD